eukprot:CAMPEP_0197691628 /NCGR_PEP_ID=MMETSP1338-20131121/109980_1 /TAXON_ID=43686 ORGANISM="Pelagodinium beii, Strain RCC1491" /NCGR_SAMPLE_ID=MMETSP1338 /ASSEMBLY_ACC=CAM_ASM_000754 /LENGTH=183 /DNA_ID=CAMNT_0043274201 /DNA_START=43 /DNA_END=594 /DNA_ORIENTATION=+
MDTALKKMACANFAMQSTALSAPEPRYARNANQATLLMSILTSPTMARPCAQSVLSIAPNALPQELANAMTTLVKLATQRQEPTIASLARQTARSATIMELVIATKMAAETVTDFREREVRKRGGCALKQGAHGAQSNTARNAIYQKVVRCVRTTTVSHRTLSAQVVVSAVWGAMKQANAECA